MRLRMLFIASIFALVCSALAKADPSWSLNSPFANSFLASQAVSGNSVAARIAPNRPSIAYRTLALAAQQPGEQSKEVKVDIKVDRGGGGKWWTNPMWIAIGVLGMLVLVLLIAFAVRGGGGTTVVSR